MKKARKKSEKSLALRVRSKAYKAPMGGAGPHKDRKNAYKRLKKFDSDAG